MSGEDIVYCKVASGTTLVARSPDKFIISFRSEVSDNSKFYFDTWYAPIAQVSETDFQNVELCNDRGASLDGILSPSNNPGTG